MNVMHDLLPGHSRGRAARAWRRSASAAINWAFRGRADLRSDSFAESGLPRMRNFRIPFTAMASACEVVLSCEDEDEAMTLAEAAINEVQRIEQKFSRDRRDGIVGRINAAAGLSAIECDGETLALLDFADSLYRASDGLFDITSSVLRRAWEFKLIHRRAYQGLAEARKLVGWERVARVGRSVRLAQVGMELDFGGFSKAYAADRAGTLMTARGARHGYVNLAGDVRVVGPKPDGTPWMVGIGDPQHLGEDLATVPVDQGALATGGNSGRPLDLQGRRHGDLLDPSTGWPVTHWRSVSVMAPLAMAAGHCRTIAMLKQAEGLEFLRASGMNYLAMDQAGTIHTRIEATERPTMQHCYA